MSSGIIASSYFSPRDVSPTGWWDMNDPNGNGTIGTNGGNVSTITDKSGNSNTLTTTSAAYPTYSNAAINGRNVVAFGTSAETYMDSPSITFGAGFSWLMVYARSNISGTVYLLDLSSVTTPEPYIIMSGTTAVASSVWTGSADKGKISGSNPVLTYGILVYTYDSVNNLASMWMNSVLAGSTAISSFSPAGSVGRRLGSHASNHDYYKGTVGEWILSANAVWTTTQRTQLQNYCASKWAITL